MNKKVASLLLVFFVVIAGGFCQEAGVPVKLTLDQAVQTALEHNTSVKQTQVKLAQSERSYKHTWNNFLPSISASVSGSESGAFAADSFSTSVSTSINASLNIQPGVAKRIQAINESYAAGLLDYEDSINQIKVTVTKTFYSILYMKEQMALSKESLSSYQEQYNQTRVKKSYGLVPEVDLLTAQLNLESARVSYKNTENSYRNSLRSFLNDIGYAGDDIASVELDGSLDDYATYAAYSFSELNVDELIENSSSLRSLKNNITQTQLSLEQTKLNTYVPSVSLSARVAPYSYMYSGDKQASSNSWSVSVGLSYSFDGLIPGSATQDNILTTEESLENLNLQLEDTRKQLKTTVEQKLYAVEIAKETVQNYQSNANLAKRSYNLAYTAYKNGTKDLSSLQSVQSSYNNAKVQLYNQQLTLINNVIELKYLLGISE